MTRPLHIFSSLSLWHSREAYLYNTLFISHHLALYYFLTPTLYVQSSLIFSLIFCGVHLCDSGFDMALHTHLSHWTQSRHHAITFLLFNTLITTIPLTLYLLSIASLASPYFPLTALIITLEIIKKILRSLLFLSHQPPICTTLEIASFITYLITVWALIFSHFPITPSTLIAPLALTSLCTTTALAYYALHRCFLPLPSATQQTSSSDTLPVARILITRITDTAVTLMRSFFSHDSAFALCALSLSPALAAHIKIIGIIMTSAYNMLHKTLIMPTKASLAHAKKFNADTTMSSTTQYATPSALFIHVLEKNTLYTKIITAGAIVITAILCSIDTKNAQIYCKATLSSLITILNQSHFIFFIPIAIGQHPLYISCISTAIAISVFATFYCAGTSFSSYTLISCITAALFVVMQKTFTNRNQQNLVQERRGETTGAMGPQPSPLK